MKGLREKLVLGQDIPVTLPMDINPHTQKKGNIKFKVTRSTTRDVKDWACYYRLRTKTTDTTDLTDRYTRFMLGSTAMYTSSCRTNITPNTDKGLFNDQMKTQIGNLQELQTAAAHARHLQK